MRVLGVLALTAVLAACDTFPTGEPSGALPPPDEANQCRASDYRWLVGRNRSEIPQTPKGAVWRVYCSDCAVTMDYNPERLNIVYDTGSGVVREVKCG
ncbi:MAG TPA: hemolysin [Caulobacteraceae bacterium]|nr:hemolysin [Caulobacteraceae bacterium]